MTILVAVKAVLTVLKADSNLAAVNANGWHLDIFPPDKVATTPYGIISLNAGGPTNLQTVEIDDEDFLVKVVAAQYASVDELAAYIRADLHEQTLTGDSAWGIYRCQLRRPVRYTEIVGQKQYIHAGGIYRIRMSSGA